MNWGVLGGEGYVARNERVAEFLRNVRSTIQRCVDAMPMHAQYVAEHCARVQA